MPSLSNSRLASALTGSSCNAILKLLVASLLFPNCCQASPNMQNVNELDGYFFDTLAARAMASLVLFTCIINCRALSQSFTVNVSSLNRVLISGYLERQ